MHQTETANSESKQTTKLNTVRNRSQNRRINSSVLGPAKMRIKRQPANT